MTGVLTIEKRNVFDIRVLMIGYDKALDELKLKNGGKMEQLLIDKAKERSDQIKAAQAAQIKRLIEFRQEGVWFNSLLDYDVVKTNKRFHGKIKTE